MSCKRFTDYSDLCIDPDGNEVIVLQESTAMTTDSDENIGGYRFLYSRDQVLRNNNESTQYQYIDTSSNSIENNSSESTMIYKTSTGQRRAVKPTENEIKWKEEEVKFLVKKYKEYITNTGKNKNFKNKKEMWNTIANDINNKFDCHRSATQCKSKFFQRFQELKRPIKLEEEINSFQDELNAINSVHEVVMDDLEATNISELEVNGHELSNVNAILGHVLPKTLIELAKINAHAQERRHLEYIEMIKEFETRYIDTISKIIDKI